MDSADDLTFKIIFSGDGAGKLRDRVKEKLKEFMGDYTDDTLVEYVIVLLKNGRRKEEARNELNVFLGDDSDSFVSWLWDHLRSNLDQYAQSKESHPYEVTKQKPQSHFESEVINSDKVSKNRRNKDWKGVIRDPDETPPLRSAIIANIHSKDDENHINQPPSPKPIIHRKRGRGGETGHTERKSHVEREAVSKSSLGASRRLLQFAVRDAVSGSRPTGLTSEPSYKRLRSVVSTPTDDSPVEERRPSITRVPKATAVATKAVADAAKDELPISTKVVTVKSSGNVFDRLGRSTDTADQFIEDDDKHDGFTQVTEATAPTYHGQYVDVGVASEFGYTEGYNNMNAQIGKSGGYLGDGSRILHYNAANVVDGTSNKRHRDQNTSVAMANSSHKIVNIYSNVNKPRGVSDLYSPKLVKETELAAGKDSNPATLSNGNGVPTTRAQSEVQKTLPSTGVNPTGPPAEDADSRTIFVNNVHFAATKDSLSRHFNKFGDVLKVLILTDASTGQPKGSAYVEFVRKESAENALSLDGTSFMSRILKVVRKSSGQQEAAAPVTSWPRVARASASRFSRGAPFPRGIGIYRSRLPMKAGIRSFQWKRDAQNSPSSDTIPSPSAASTTPRSLTYVRTEAAKTHANSNNAAT
ncbi:hypothetical protein SSX86_013016 [Deinandra increscens subsp. villosa]|uniref:RRM domain-containing protein n=1 Tax=Deinandra increscens subsp. villosa TaxID=3103831 RepID=A0AAP0D9P4_9ASTR